MNNQVSTNLNTQKSVSEIIDWKDAYKEGITESNTLVVVSISINRAILTDGRNLFQVVEPNDFFQISKCGIGDTVITDYGTRLSSVLRQYSLNQGTMNSYRGNMHNYIIFDTSVFSPTWLTTCVLYVSDHSSINSFIGFDLTIVSSDISIYHPQYSAQQNDRYNSNTWLTGAVYKISKNMLIAA